MTDPVLQANGAKALYWKTGHSYMKRYTFEQKALVGFEKSGHFFFNPPLGRGYDDGLVSALAVCDMLDRKPGKSMADLQRALPKTCSLADHVAALRRRDEVRHRRSNRRRIRRYCAKRAARSQARSVRDLVTVNGVRVTLEDGTWGLVRASSNKPELVVVVESPVSEANKMRDVPRHRGAACQAPGSWRVQSEDLRRTDPFR